MKNVFTQVFKSDGSIGLEHTVGNLRYDLSSPAAPPSVILDSKPGTTTIMRPDGHIDAEVTAGSMRTTIGASGFDILSH